MKQDYQNTEYKREREIQLTDLFWKILYAWRFVLICTIVMQILVSGYKYLAEKRESNITSQYQDISNEEKRAELTETEQSALAQAENIQQQLEAKQFYQGNSILINMDAYAKNVVTLEYYVDTNYTFSYMGQNQPDYTDALIDAYIAYVENKGLLGSVCDSLDWSAEDTYVGELISVGERALSDGNLTNAGNAGGKTFTVYVTGEDADSAGELADAVADAIASYQLGLEASIGTHELTLIDRYASVQTDDKLAASQTSLVTDITDLQTKLDTLTASFSETQKQILEGNTGSAADDTAVQEPEISMKYLLFGAALGFFMACAWIILRYILSNKVKTADEFNAAYGLCIFGSIVSEELGKRRFLSVVDRWLDKIHNKRLCIADKQNEFTGKNLSLICKKENIEKILFVTSLRLEEQDREKINAFIDFMNEAGIQAFLEEEVTSNTAALEKLADIGKAVLLEKTGTSDYGNVERTITCCRELKADILGCLIIERLTRTSE